MPSAVRQVGVLRPTGGVVARRAGRLGVAWGLLALVVYGLTCAPGVEWQDSGTHQWRVLTGQLEHRRGLALSHPLHYWLGRAAVRLPLGEPAYCLNLMSAACGAVGVGMLVTLVARLTHSRLAAALAGTALLTAHSFWQMSVITETYTLAAALMTVEWYLLLRYAGSRHPRLLAALFAVNGLHVANHLLGLLTLVTYAALLLERVARRQLRARWLVICAALWIVTTAPYWTLAVSHYQRTGELTETLRSAFFGGGPGSRGWAKEVLNLEVSGQQLQLVALTLGYNFPALAIPLALVGLLRPARRRGRLFRRVLLGQTVIIGVFVGRYPIVDLYTYFVPVCVLVALWFGLGIDRVWRLVRRPRTRTVLVSLLIAHALWPVAVYWWFPKWARQRELLGTRLRDLPCRDEYAYFFRPWRCCDRSAASFAQMALERTGPGGWLLADSTTGPATAYFYLVHGGPPELRVYSERDCLTDAAQPPLSDDELTEFLRDGGNVLVVPGSQTERIWGRRFMLEEDTPDFWSILRPTRGSAATIRPDQP